MTSFIMISCFVAVNSYKELMQSIISF